MSYLISEGAAPSTPATGKVAVYAKTDGRVYGKDDVGTEFNMTGLTLGTLTASTSGTTVDFTGIPAGVKVVKIMFLGVSTSGTSNILFQIGDSGGIEPTGYLGAGSFCGATTAGSNFTTGYGLNGANAANVLHGTLTLTLIDSATNTWVASGVFGGSNSAFTYQVAGSKALTGTLDRVRITALNGTDTFDAGSINIAYE
jgi:hypothetical protein